MGLLQRVDGVERATVSSLNLPLWLNLQQAITTRKSLITSIVVTRFLSNVENSLDDLLSHPLPYPQRRNISLIFSQKA